MTPLTRVHYMAMIQFCSRTNKFDGELRPVDARRASDMEDPQSHIDELIALELVTRHVTGDGERFRIVEIDQHVPPPHLREKPRREAGVSRTQRYRAHKAGDHSICLPQNCPDAPVTADVTRHPGTGQDGPGLEGLAVDQRTGELPWPEVHIPRQGVVDLKCWCEGRGCPQCDDDLAESMQ